MGSRRGNGPPGPAERRRLQALLLLPPPKAARALLGCRLVVAAPGGRAVARIVETEAYLGVGDPAAHAYFGRTARTEPLWGPPGTWYVYLVYGMHHCLNVAVEPRGRPGCVLIRAAEIEGADPRAGQGPGRLTRALGIDRSVSGSDALGPKGRLWLREGTPPSRVQRSRRIGIRWALERRLRFFDPQSPAVSAPRLTARRGPA